MDPVNIATIIVALIAAAGAWASQRASSKAAAQNTLVSGRVDMEKEAYDRARAFDTETINRQNVEIEELRLVNAQCVAKIADMDTKHEIEINMLRSRIARLERATNQKIEELLREQLRHHDTDTDV